MVGEAIQLTWVKFLHIRSISNTHLSELKHFNQIDGKLRPQLSQYLLFVCSKCSLISLPLITRPDMHPTLKEFQNRSKGVG